jgi:hypothetical protein
VSSGDGERPRRSWSEIDKLRDKPRERREREAPRSPHVQERVRQATKEYLKQVDRAVFSGKRRPSEADRAADELRRSHGTPELAAACRAYRDAQGLPEDPSLLSLFLDAGDSELVVAALDALRGLHERGALEAGPGLRSQLRMLAGGFDDAAAEAAEALLARL